MEMRPKRDPLICECCRSSEAVAYDLPTGLFVCSTCSARLRQERLQRAAARDGQRAPAQPPGDRS